MYSVHFYDDQRIKKVPVLIAAGTNMHYCNLGFYDDLIVQSEKYKWVSMSNFKNKSLNTILNIKS